MRWPRARGRRARWAVRVGALLVVGGVAGRLAYGVSPFACEATVRAMHRLGLVYQDNPTLPPGVDVQAIAPQLGMTVAEARTKILMAVVLRYSKSGAVLHTRYATWIVRARPGWLVCEEDILTYPIDGHVDWETSGYLCRNGRITQISWFTNEGHQTASLVDPCKAR